MFKKILPLALACCFAVSCDEDKEAIPVQYLQVTVDASYLSTSESDDWLVLQDNEGNLLSAKPFERNDVVIFDSTKAIASPLSFTIFRDEGDRIYNIKSYLGIASGEKLILRNTTPQFAPAASTGKLVVTVTDDNLGAQFDAALSWKEYYDLPDANSTPTQRIFRGRDVTSTFDDFFLFMTDKNDNPKYLFLENVNPGSVNFSLADFNDFDKTIRLVLPGSSDRSVAFVQGFETDQVVSASHGYRVNSYLNGLLGYSRSSFTLGYLNRFSKYLTSATADYPGYQLSYTAQGPAPTADIALAKADVNISNNTQTGFTITGSDFDWRVTEFSHRSNSNGHISWSFYSDKNNMKNITLPAAFLDRFPNFNGTLTKHSGTRFFKGTSYEKFILGHLRGDQPLDSFIMTATTIY